MQKEYMNFKKVFYNKSIKQYITDWINLLQKLSKKNEKITSRQKKYTKSYCYHSRGINYQCSKIEGGNLARTALSRKSASFLKQECWDVFGSHLPGGFFKDKTLN